MFSQFVFVLKNAIFAFKIDFFLSFGHYYPCGNFSDTSSWMFLISKGSIGHAFTVRIRTENQNQASFSPFGPREISVLTELTLGHLRYRLTDVPPQPNSPPDLVSRTGCLVWWRDVKLKFSHGEIRSFTG